MRFCQACVSAILAMKSSVTTSSSASVNGVWRSLRGSSQDGSELVCVFSFMSYSSPVGRLLPPVDEQGNEEQGYLLWTLVWQRRQKPLNHPDEARRKPRLVGCHGAHCSAREAAWLKAARMECPSMTVSWCIEPSGDLVRCASPLTHVADFL